MSLILVKLGCLCFYKYTVFYSIHFSGRREIRLSILPKVVLPVDICSTAGSGPQDLASPETARVAGMFCVKLVFCPCQPRSLHFGLGKAELAAFIGAYLGGRKGRLSQVLS